MSSIKPPNVKFYNGTDNNASTIDYINMTDAIELCGNCHTERVQNMNHGNVTDQANCLDCHMTKSRKTINEWDIRSHTFKVDDGVTYTADPPSNFPNLTCYQCHDTPEFASMLQGKINDWSGSDHGNSNHGYNSNTYCAKCMSPFEYDMSAVNSSVSDPISAENWTNIRCSVCHNLHDTPSDNVYVYNGTDYKPVDTAAEMCGNCHGGSDHHHEYEDWSSSAHSDTNHGYNSNSYCAHCMSPFQAEPGVNSSTSSPVDPVNWTSITCNVCHEPHTLELELYDGEKRVEINDISRDLCGGCHQGSHHPETAEWNASAHGNTNHGYNSNTYCAKCMSPYQYDPAALNSSLSDPVSAENWTAIGCIVCHDPHTLEVALFNGTEREEPVKDISRDLCGVCHQGSHHPETENWEGSSHGNTNHGYNANTYCAKCMSPFQFDETVNRTTADSISQENWTDIGCAVCHHPHSLELRLFNGTEWEDPVDDPSDLCGGCHGGSDHHHIYDDWEESAHSNSYHGYNANTYCAKCMSPFQSDPSVNRSTSSPVDEADWDGIGCIVCHEQHTLELELFNGSGREEAVEVPDDLCAKCHGGSDHHHISDDVDESAHGDSYHGYNGNTYCAKCMSPFQYDPAAVNRSASDPVSEENWTGINCIVCHDPHSLELALFNGTDREDHVENPADLCGGCHGGSDHHHIYDDWEESIHANSYHPEDNNTNTYCAKCMSPFQFDADATHDVNDPVLEEDWDGVNCIVCHDQHTLELALFNGTAREEPVESITDLCGACHGGSEYHPIYDDWKESGHANTYRVFTANTYCAHCMSPMQAGSEAVQAERNTISEENWTSVGCIVCHDPHIANSETLLLYNGSAYVSMADTDELCGSCHTMGDATIGDEPHHPQLEMRTGTGGIGILDIPFMGMVDCNVCHMYEANHSFEPHMEACLECHDVYKDADDVQERVDKVKEETMMYLEMVEHNLTFTEIA
jgi:hypothetical protein